MKDTDLTTSISDANDLRDRLWAYEDFSAAQEHPSIEVTGAFASLGFLRAALRRTRRFWLGLTVLGFVVGCGIYVASPPGYTASTTLLLTNPPGSNPQTVMLTDGSVAASLPVAAAVVRQLGLDKTPTSMLSSYTTTPVTDQVMQISVNAPTGAQAVQWAQAIGTQFLKFRANLLTTQAQQDDTQLNTQTTQAEQNLNALGTRITNLGGTIPSLSSTPPSQTTAPKTQLGKLQAQYLDAANKLQVFKQGVAETIAQNQMNVTSEINGSQILDQPTLGKHSEAKLILYTIVGATFGGLALGMIIVVVRALISDRLRRRDDISFALGVPVKLSVGPVARRRFSFSTRTRAEREYNLRMLATYLCFVAQRRSRQAVATLAVLPIDNADTIVPAVSQMVESCAMDGKRVVVADLVRGAPLARALGGAAVGTKVVQLSGTSVAVVVPEPDDIVSRGPLRPAGAPPVAAPPSKGLLSAYRSADLLITFTEPDPALGGEHLATWATDGVAVMTTGLTHGQKAHSVGEILRLSGVRVNSAVLVNADEDDDSLGVEPALQEFLASHA